MPSCHACYAYRTTVKCIQQDGMYEILEKLIQADVILLATPVYFYSMDAQMKILIDPSLARYQELKFVMQVLNKISILEVFGGSNIRK